MSTDSMRAAAEQSLRDRRENALAMPIRDGNARGPVVCVSAEELLAATAPLTPEELHAFSMSFESHYYAYGNAASALKQALADCGAALVKARP